MQKGGAGNSSEMIKQMTKSFKDAENNMIMGESAEDVIKRLDSTDLSQHINEMAEKKISEKMKEVEALAKQNENMNNAIRDKERQIQQEQLQKEKLQQMLAEMEQKMVKGGDEDKKEDKTKAKAFREYQLKIK